MRRAAEGTLDITAEKEDKEWRGPLFPLTVRWGRKNLVMMAATTAVPFPTTAMSFRARGSDEHGWAPLQYCFKTITPPPPPSMLKRAILTISLPSFLPLPLPSFSVKITIRDETGIKGVLG